MFQLKIENNLILKPLQDFDAKDLFLFVDSNRSYFSEILNWVDFINTVEDEQNYIESLKKDDSNISFVILLDGQIIGSIGFICIDKLNKNAQIGYCIDAKFQGKGIATKACKRCIQYGFEELDLERIEFRILKENFKSKAVAQKLSAVFEGILRKAYLLKGKYLDSEIYSILKD